jgi:ornithine carbamoyltransferase
MEPRHFLDIDDFETSTLREILDHAHSMKKTFAKGSAKAPKPAKGLVLAMLFDKPSTRTRVSFDVAMRQLGGETIVLNYTDMQLGRGESIGDTARVLSRYVDVLMMRSNAHETLVELAQNADVPVINGLTDRSHPCQILADIMTLEEKKERDIASTTVVWVGDACNNVATSWIHAAVRFGFKLKVASPPSLDPAPALLDWARRHGGDIEVLRDPAEAVTGADCVVTDVWVSMGHNDREARIALLTPYQVNAALMEKAGPDAIFMHCLPAQRGQEVTDDVIDGPQSVVFDEAENRLHAQRAILAWCLEKV